MIDFVSGLDWVRETLPKVADVLAEISFPVLSTVVLAAGIVTLVGAYAYDHVHPAVAIAANQIPDASTPTSSVKASFAETLKLAERCTKSSKAIYAFLKKQAMRTDEPKVVAEYRAKFDAQVVNIFLDLITAGLSKAESLSVPMTPPTSVEEIQWIARFLATFGKTFGPDLARNARVSGAGTLVRTKRTNEGRYPRIESAVDSFGHEPEELAPGVAVAEGTEQTLTPGDEVRFKVKLSDPDGDDAIVSLIPHGGLSENANVAVSDNGDMTWNVRNEDVSDQAYVSILVRSQREFHRRDDGVDDLVSFVYRVVSRV